MIFSVWAPLAKSVDLLLGARRIALQALHGGYWQVDAAAEPGQGYKFSIDGAAAVLHDDSGGGHV